LLVREPVGVVGAIIPWNAPLSLIAYKVAPALIAGCTVVLKASPEAPGEAYVVAEVADSVGLPPGVLNVLTADREVSELLVRDPRVDKMLDQAQVELDQSKRESDWGAIDKKVMQDAVIYPGVDAKSVLLRSKNLTNVFVNDAYGMYDYMALGVK
jgi:ABC-type transport system substrate-binding protein